jgi:hypothetical protein
MAMEERIENVCEVLRLNPVIRGIDLKHAPVMKDGEVVGSAWSLRVGLEVIARERGRLSVDTCFDANQIDGTISWRRVLELLEETSPEAVWAASEDEG